MLVTSLNVRIHGEKRHDHTMTYAAAFTLVCSSRAHAPRGDQKAVSKRRAFIVAAPLSFLVLALHDINGDECAQNKANWTMH